MRAGDDPAYARALDYAVKTAHRTGEVVELPFYGVYAIPDVKITELFANTGEPGPATWTARFADGRSVSVYRS